MAGSKEEYASKIGLAALMIVGIQMN